MLDTTTQKISYICTDGSEVFRLDMKISSFYWSSSLGTSNFIDLERMEHWADSGDIWTQCKEL